MTTAEKASIATDSGKASGRIEELPLRYRQQIHTLLKQAEKLDVGYRHYWVRVTQSQHNEQLKRWGGWEPLDDPERIKRIGLGHLPKGPSGAPKWMDTELWCMPMARAEVIRKHRAEESAAHLHQKREEVDAEFAEIAGRSHGKVRPFVSENKTETITVS